MSHMRHKTGRSQLSVVYLFSSRCPLLESRKNRTCTPRLRVSPGKRRTRGLLRRRRTIRDCVSTPLSAFQTTEVTALSRGFSACSNYAPFINRPKGCRICDILLVVVGARRLCIMPVIATSKVWHDASNEIHHPGIDRSESMASPNTFLKKPIDIPTYVFHRDPSKRPFFPLTCKPLYSKAGFQPAC